MLLKKLNLLNFRNYSNLLLTFEQRPTVLVGDNAEGKSNLLEAIYLLSTSKSARAEMERELVKKGENFCRVEGLVTSGENEETQLTVIIQSDEEELFRKRVLVNGIGRRVVDFIGNLPAVIFYPQDINMVTGPPSLRRWHLDLVLAQIDPQYKRSLTLYEQFLTARNRVLKRIREGEGKKDELDYWTQGLLDLARVILEKRKQFFEFIESLTKPLGEFTFSYNQSVISKQRLEELNGREVASATTLVGPHRDDFSIELAGRNLSSFGSRGEQRTATLAFKLAQLEFMEKVTGKRPLLLLDEIFSELDASHRAHIVDIVGKQQTIIATVELENIPKQFLNSARVLKVENGQVIS